MSALGLADEVEPIAESGSWYLGRERHWTLAWGGPEGQFALHSHQRHDASSAWSRKRQRRGWARPETRKSWLTTTRSLRVDLGAVSRACYSREDSLSAHCESLFVHGRHAGSTGDMHVDSAETKRSRDVAQWLLLHRR
jgi:hypothetical protein